jgi:hypothetical protein
MKQLILMAAPIFLSLSLAAQNGPAKGSFGYDQAFLKKYYPDVITLSSKNGQAQVLVSPQHQGRVMTSSAEGLTGRSFGWLNYSVLEARKAVPHMTPVGGEERFWLGPEGGQFALYFKKGDPFDFDHWQVPAEIDYKPFGLVRSSDDEASFEQKIELVNYAGTPLKMNVRRSVRLLDDETIFQKMSVPSGPGVSVVGYETVNSITNTGDNTWNEQTGMPSIWLLSMLNPGPHTTVFIPFYRDGDKKFLTDDYFGKVPADRLKVVGDYLFFKADGKLRSKLGIAGFAGLTMAASYDADAGVLTFVRCQPAFQTDKYVNSLWKIQDDPFGGDAINAYNDGPLADGTQMGPFYEIETSSPAAGLKPGESLMHTQRVLHIKAGEKELDLFTRYMFQLSLDDIKKVFQ